MSLTRHYAVWGLAALLLAVAPLLFSSDASLSLLSQIGTVTVFALSYNMLLGQGGMLSFGHAVYSGLGAFCAIHAINRAATGEWAVPLILVPLVGGLAGMLFGAVFGYANTRRGGTAFAMISLGIAELVHAGAMLLPGFFGGEGGVAGNRVYEAAVFGVTWGPQRQVYYLIASWLFASALAMFAFTRTPLGRVLNAVRDNPERAGFIGYDANQVRYLTLMLSAFFAGISGSLGAINFEIVSAEALGASRSGMILLFTVIGGTGFFVGPLIGAVVGVCMTVLLPAYTKAWQFYLGLFFILVVMRAPNGIAGVLAQWRAFKPAMVPRVAMAALVFAGTVMLVEMLYRRTLDSASGAMLQVAGVVIDSAAPAAWLCAALLIALGAIGLWWRR